MSKQSDLVSVSQGASGDPLFIDTVNDRVGVGTSSPTATLTAVTGVSGNNEGEVRVSDNASYYGSLSRVNASDEVRLGSYGASQNLTFYTVASERMRITSTGSVGIGTSSPAVRFHVTSPDNYVAGIESSTSVSLLGFKASNTTGTIDDANVAVGATGDALYLRSGGTERARIDASGNLMVGTTAANGNGVTISGTQGNNFWSSKTTSTAGYNQLTFSNPNGIVGFIQTGGSSTIYSTSSDYRLKENVVPLAGAADRLAQIPVCRFNFIADPDTTVDGFLAHEVQAFVPECVTGEKDQVETVEVTDEDGNVIGTEERPVYQGIDQSKLVPLLTAALQEAMQKIDALETRISALETN
jgi:hypothetical protein